MLGKAINFIITLTGPSGCGKSYVINRIMELNEKIQDFFPVRVSKYVTRPLRSNEIKEQLEGKEIDVISVDHIPDTCEIKYQTYGKKYGLELKTLEEHLRNGKSPIVIINDVRVVEELKKEFPERVLALFLFREIPRQETFVNQSGIRGNVAKTETEERFNKAISIYRTYIENIGLFNRVIINPIRTLGSEDYAKIQVKNVIKGVLNGKISLEAKRNGKPKLFIIAGNAASGKDEIIQAVNDMGKLQATIIPKYTSRMQDEEDGDEMICKYVPKKSKLNKYEKDYQSDLKEIAVHYNESVTCDDIEKLTIAKAENMKRINAIPKATERFWLALRKEKEAIKKELRKRILNESAPEHFLKELNLFERSFSELFELYRTEGYHKKGLQEESAFLSNSGIDEQTIINRIEEEADVKHDICLKKLNVLSEKQLWDLYGEKGYHSKSVNTISYKRYVEKKILTEFFENNDRYLDLEKINQDNKKEITQKTKNQIFKVTGPAYYLEVEDKGVVMYENNKTLYGFKICDLPDKVNIHYKEMLRQNKHCVLVASLIDIFNICKPFFDDNIITVFSYSEISSEEFQKNTKAGTVDLKVENFEKEIKKYSEYIAGFDHVAIYAESEFDKRNGGRTEELIDQIFRLFRFYNVK